MFNDSSSTYIPLDTLWLFDTGYDTLKPGAYFSSATVDEILDDFDSPISYLLTDAAQSLFDEVSWEEMTRHWIYPAFLEDAFSAIPFQENISNYFKSLGNKPCVRPQDLTVEYIENMPSEERRFITVKNWFDVFTKQPDLPANLFPQLTAQAIADMRNAFWGNPALFQYLNAEQTQLFLQSTNMLQNWGEEAQWEKFPLDALAKAIVNMATYSPITLAETTAEQWEEIFYYQPELPQKLLLGTNPLSADQQQLLSNLIWPALRAIGTVEIEKIIRVINRDGFCKGFFSYFTDDELNFVLSLMAPQDVQAINKERWLELFTQKSFLFTPALLAVIPQTVLDDSRMSSGLLKIAQISAHKELNFVAFDKFIAQQYPELPDDYKLPLLQRMLEALDPNILNSDSHLIQFIEKCVWATTLLNGEQEQEAFITVAALLNDNKINLSHAAIKILINKINQFDLENRGIIFETIAKFLLDHPDRETSRSVTTDYRKNTELMLEKIGYLAEDVQILAFEMIYAIAIPHFLEGTGFDSLGFRRDWKGLYVKFFKAIKNMSQKNQEQAWDIFRGSVFYNHGFLSPGPESSRIVDLGEAIRKEIDDHFPEKIKERMRAHLQDYIDHARTVYWLGFLMAAGHGMTTALARRHSDRFQSNYHSHLNSLKFNKIVSSPSSSVKNHFQLKGHSISVAPSTIQTKTSWAAPAKIGSGGHSETPIYTQKYFYVVKKKSIIKTGTGISSTKNPSQESSVLRLRGGAIDEGGNKRKNTHIRFDSDSEDISTTPKSSSSVAIVSKRPRTKLQERRPQRTEAQKYKPTQKESEAGIASEGDSDSEDPNYAYRALRLDEVPSDPSAIFTQGLHAKNINSEVTVSGHIATGSRAGAGSSYISATASRKIAGAYAAETAASAQMMSREANISDYGYIVKFRLNNKVQANTLDTSKPLATGQSVDFTDKNISNKYFPGNPQAKAFATASQEVLVKDSVPGSDIVSISKVKKLYNLEHYFHIRKQGRYGDKKVDAAFQGRAQRTYKNEKQTPFPVILYDTIPNPNLSSI